MKKIALLATVFTGFATLQSCTIEEYYDEHYYDGFSQVFELTNETLSTVENAYTYSGTWNFDPPIYGSDNVLVYRQVGANTWEILPKTYNLGGGDMVQYDYDFTRYDVKIYFSANFPLVDLSNAEYNEFVYRQTYRVVVIPGGYAKADYSDYNTTIKMLNLENTPIKTLSSKNK